jgi:hypothetical protein
MRSQPIFRHLLSRVTPVVLVTGGFAVAIADSTQATPIQVAQASLSGQCRRINTDYVGVFKQPASTTGTRVSVLRTGTVVRLADGGNGQGWIKIDAPTEGYLEARYLAMAPCPTNLSQQPTQLPSALAAGSETGVCRRVKQPSEGLVIRSQPSSASAAVGGVAQNATVNLSSSPATSQRDGAGRVWVQIVAPNAGWVSNGFPDQPSNLVYCSDTPPAAEQPPTPVGSLCRRVISPPEGLLIRNNFSAAAPVVGGVGLGQQVTVTTPLRSAKDPTGRYWVQISAPAAGWISNGYPGSSHLGMCP